MFDGKKTASIKIKTKKWNYFTNDYFNAPNSVFRSMSDIIYAFHIHFV